MRNNYYKFVGGGFLSSWWGATWGGGEASPAYPQKLQKADLQLLTCS